MLAQQNECSEHRVRLTTPVNRAMQLADHNRILYHSHEESYTNAIHAKERSSIGQLSLNDVGATERSSLLFCNHAIQKLRFWGSLSQRARIGLMTNLAVVPMHWLDDTAFSHARINNHDMVGVFVAELPCRQRSVAECNSTEPQHLRASAVGNHFL